MLCSGCVLGIVHLSIIHKQAEYLLVVNYYYGEVNKRQSCGAVCEMKQKGLWEAFKKGLNKLMKDKSINSS